MNTYVKTILAAVAASLFAISSCNQSNAPVSSTAASAATTTADWRENYAYTLGMHAYVFGYPWIFLPQLRWQWVTQPKNPQWTPYAPLNHFWHMRDLATDAYRDGGAPNNDTLYSIAWLDLAKEPVILSVPETGSRYYTMELASLDCDNFAYVGTRMTGSKAGNYALVGPDWKGTLPPGVTALPPSRTNAVLIFGRTLVYGLEDVAKARQLQDQYHLTPMSLWGKSGGKAPEIRTVFKPFDTKDDPLAEWKTMNRAMTEDPPMEQHQVLMRMFATIGVGPNQDFDKLDSATRNGLERAARDGRKMMQDSFSSGGIGTQVNGWSYPPMTAGRAGLHDEFLNRGVVCMVGMIINDPVEAIYINTSKDSEGKRLSGAHRYRIHFAPGGLPKVGAFWSLTMYGMDNNLVANPIDRYKLGTYPENSIQPEADGGLTLYLQRNSPGGNLETNWLPAPDAEFYLVLRNYLPSPEILDGSWLPPSVERLD